MTEIVIAILVIGGLALAQLILADRRDAQRTDRIIDAIDDNTAEVRALRKAAEK